MCASFHLKKNMCTPPFADFEKLFGAALVRAYYVCASLYEEHNRFSFFTEVLFLCNNLVFF